MELRAAELIQERERISRSERDSLLQSIQGLMYRFQAVANSLALTEPARAVMIATLDCADRLIEEARERLNGSHRVDVDSGNLEDVLMAIAADRSRGDHKRFCVSIEGTSSALLPEARHALIGIGAEALNNAYRHSMGTQVEMDIVYDAPSHLTLRVRDNGRGFDVDSWGQRPGHFGFIGIQEHASQLHTRANIWSRPGAGTEISVRVAGETAYLSRRPRGFRSWLAEKLAALWGRNDGRIRPNRVE
jgi:signal transduction histidine kinase